MTTVGPCAAPTLYFPTKGPVIELPVERLHACALIGGISGWRMAENLHCGSRYTMPSSSYGGKCSIAYGQRLRMNDCHHVNSQCKVFRMIGSRF